MNEQLLAGRLCCRESERVARSEQESDTQQLQNNCVSAETTPTTRTAIERRRPVAVASGTAVAHAVVVVVVVAKEDYAPVASDDVRRTN